MTLVLVLAPLAHSNPTADTTLWLTVSLATIIGTVGQCISLLQLFFVRQHIEFRSYTHLEFIQELTDLLHTVQSGDTFYWYCTVHDPCLPILAGNSSYDHFLATLARICADQHVKKYIATLPPDDPLLPFVPPSPRFARKGESAVAGI